MHAEPYSIVRVRDRRGRELYAHQAKAKQTIDAPLAGVLNAALLPVVQRGTGDGRPSSRHGRSAARRARRRNYGDAWFIGITQPLATAVWVGHPEAIVPMTNVHGRSVTGGSLPAAIFSDTMKAALAGQRPVPLFTASPDSLGLAD